MFKILRRHNLKYLNQSEDSSLVKSGICKYLHEEFDYAVRNIFNNKYSHNNVNPVINELEKNCQKAQCRI